MLLANAIALAQEGCYFDAVKPTHPASGQEETAWKRDWTRVICVFIYLVDEHLALRLGLEPLLPEKSKKTVVDLFSKIFASTLPEKELWTGYFELTGEIRQIREYLHNLDQTTSRSYSNDILPVLEYTSMSLERWRRQNRHTTDGRCPTSLI